MSRGYGPHRVVGSVRKAHKMNGLACRARWKMLVFTPEIISNRTYYCDPCKVGIGESAPIMFRDLERERRKEGKYKWPRRSRP